MSVNIEQVRAFLRYDDGDNDEALNILLQAGQDWVEGHTGQLLTRRDVSQHVSFGPVVDLLWGPYEAESIAVKYLDHSFTEQTFDGAMVRLDGRVIAKSAWPKSDSATLSYRAGYETVDAAPACMIHAVCLYCAMSDEDRGDVTASAWTALRNVLGRYWKPVIA